VLSAINLLDKAVATTVKNGSQTMTGTITRSQLDSLADGEYTVSVYWGLFDKYGIPVGTEISEGVKFSVGTPGPGSVSEYNIFRVNTSNQPDDQGGRIRYSIKSAIKQVSPGEVGSFVLRYRKTGSTAWTVRNLNLSAGSINVADTLPETYAITDGLEAQLTLTDKYSGIWGTSVTFDKLVPSARALLHLLPSKNALAVGKYVDQDGYSCFDVNLPTKLKEDVTFYKPNIARNSLGFGGMQAKFYVNTRSAVDVNLLIPINLSDINIIGNSITPVLLANTQYCYAFRVDVRGMYMLAMDLVANQPGTAANTTANIYTRMYVVSSLAQIPLTTQSIVVGRATDATSGGFSTPVINAALTNPLKYFGHYEGGATTVTTSGANAGVAYLDVGWYIAFYWYVRAIAKQMYNGNRGIGFMG